MGESMGEAESNGINSGGSECLKVVQSHRSQIKKVGPYYFYSRTNPRCRKATGQTPSNREDFASKLQRFFQHLEV